METVRKYQVVVCDEERIVSILRDLEVTSVDQLVKTILAQVVRSEKKTVYLADPDTGLSCPLTDLPTDSLLRVHVRTAIEFKGTLSIYPGLIEWLR